MIVFLANGKEYRGSTALEIARALESEAEDYPYRGQAICRFLNWSLQRLAGRIPPRDLSQSDRLRDDELALSYLCLHEEYGLGKLFIIGNRGTGSARR